MKKIIIIIGVILVSLQSMAQSVTTTDTATIKGSYFVTWRDLYKFFLLVTSAQNLTANMQSSIDSIKSKVLFTQTAIKTLTANGQAGVKASIIGTGVGTMTIPSSVIVPGKTYRIHMEGVYSTPVVSISTVTCRMELNSTIITTAVASSLLASASNSAFSADQTITFYTTGATGTVSATGQLVFAGTGTTRAFVDMNTGVSPVTFNTTPSTITFAPTIQFSNSVSGNSVSSLICTFEQLN